VLHTIPTARSGGIETFVLGLARRLDRDRFDLDVCVLGEDGPIADELRALRVPVVVLGLPAAGRARPALAFAAHLVRRRIDVVHVNAGGRLLRRLARVCGARAVLTHVHAPADAWIPRLASGDRRLSAEMRRAIADGSDEVLVSSDHMRRVVVRHCPALGDRMRVVPYGTDLERSADPGAVAALRTTFQIDRDRRVAGFVGRLVQQKGVPHLLRASEILLRRASDVALVVVGDGPLRGEVERFARRHPGRVVVLGDRRDVPTWMALFDVLVVSSEWEPFGIVALEAMAAGRPVVAFGVDGLPEVVAHEETGLLAPAGDAEALAAGVERVLTDPELARRMGRAARRTVEDRFSDVAVARTLESRYVQLTDGQGDLQARHAPSCGGNS
jgi:glycosyltransferase involved in cell wall biosynthesis